MAKRWDVELERRLRRHYLGDGLPLPSAGIVPEPAAAAHAIDERSFVTEIAGRTFLTAPASSFTTADSLPSEMAEAWERASQANPHFLWVQGAYVEAEKANRNGAFWSTGDLQFGEMSVKHGPINWLHQSRKVIGTIADNRLIFPSTPESAAESYTPPKAVQAEAQRALDWIKQGHAGSGFTDVGRARAAQLAAGKAVSLDTIRRMHSYLSRHTVDKKGKGFSQGEDGYPSAGRVAWAAWGGDAAISWVNGILDNADKNETAASDSRPYIAAVGAVWRYIYPEETAALQLASETGSLYWSMECVAEEVACVSDGNLQGCGQTFGYMDAIRQQACEHINNRTSARRMVNPSFLGGAVIVPPVKPGWGEARMEVMRQASALAEQAEAASIGMSATDFELLMAQVVKYAYES